MKGSENLLRPVSATVQRKKQAVAAFAFFTGYATIKINSVGGAVFLVNAADFDDGPENP